MAVGTGVIVQAAFMVLVITMVVVGGKTVREIGRALGTITARGGDRGNV